MSGPFRVINGPHAGKTFAGIIAAARKDTECWVRTTWLPPIFPDRQPWLRKDAAPPLPDKE